MDAWPNPHHHHNVPNIFRVNYLRVSLNIIYQSRQGRSHQEKRMTRMANQLGSPGFPNDFIVIQLTAMSLEDSTRLKMDKMTFMPPAQKLNQVSIPCNCPILIPGQNFSP